MRLSSQVMMMLAGALSLSACAASILPAQWPEVVYTSPVSVKDYIDKHLEAYGSAMRNASGQRDAFAGSTILAALAGTTALALGAGTNVGILAGSIGAGANAANGYAKPQDRVQLISKAVEATQCVRDEFTNQQVRLSAVGLADRSVESFAERDLTPRLRVLKANPFLKLQASGAGEIAVDATRSIATATSAR